MQWYIPKLLSNEIVFWAKDGFDFACGSFIISIRQAKHSVYSNCFGLKNSSDDPLLVTLTRTWQTTSTSLNMQKKWDLLITGKKAYQASDQFSDCPCVQLSENDACHLSQPDDSVQLQSTSWAFTDPWCSSQWVIIGNCIVSVQFTANFFYIILYFGFIFVRLGCTEIVLPAICATSSLL
jgi:hypothetical protein